MKFISYIIHKEIENRQCFYDTRKISKRRNKVHQYTLMDFHQRVENYSQFSIKD